MDFDEAYSLIVKKITNWSHEFVLMLPNFLVALIALVLGFLIARGVRRIARKVIFKVSTNSALNGLFISVIYFVFIIITLFVVLSILQLDKAVVSILAGAGVLGLALAFAFQDIAANFISGVFISLRRPIQIGDIVKIGEYMGEVTDINLRDTVLLTFQGQLVIIPNKSVFQNPIENYSMLGKRRMDLEVGVSYGEDLERVMRITLDAVKNIEGLSKDEQTTMFYKEFGGSSINYTIRLWLENVKPASYLIVCNPVIINIKKAYDENDIMIPFPIRTLDFGIKGGKELSEVNLSILDGKSS